MRLIQHTTGSLTGRHGLPALTAVVLSGLLGIPLVATSAGAASLATLTPVASAPAGHVGATVPAVAAPVGKLRPRGCSASGTTATCELYAMAGSASVLGQPVPIWGFSSTGNAGSATAPGPLLVVNQGDSVTVNLHNQLAEPVSLAFPGQPASAFTAGLTASASGAGAGGSQAYTFTASRAGTFLYEAGHTANGTRQVAMGLAGALVVLAADGTAYGTRSGVPNTAYDDDAVLVLSEIDPALNAAPTTFDMRSFRPHYRLINGKPFPSSDPISTDQGHRVLLRYVNVGSQSHSMSLLGDDQTQVAQDGHPMRYAETSVTETVEPGATTDTIVTMPTGPEAKVTLYEANGHLNSNGQSTADPLQVAFGGMLTFLDTAAPPPTSDGVGPVSTHIKLSPNPSDGLAPVKVTADLSDATTGGSNVVQSELVVDDAVSTGVGFGAPMTAAFGTVDVTAVTGSIPATAPDCAPTVGPPPLALACLEAGRHTVFVRALDSAGNWGVVGSAILNLPKTGPRTTNGGLSRVPANGAEDLTISATGDDSAAEGKITAAEYFLDTAGANGTGTALALNRTAAVVSEDATIPAAIVKALGEGAHHVLAHSKDSLGLWGPPLDMTLQVDLTGPGVEAASVGPNPTNGVLTDKSNPGYLVVSARITDRDAGGAIQGLLNDAEGFLDPKSATPAGGTGFQLIASDGKMDSATETVYGLIPISQARALANGVHHVFVRGQDDAGNWGDMFAVDLVVDKAAPVLTSLSAAPNPTNGATTLTLSASVNEQSFAAAEYWIGTTDPGAGKALAVPVSLVNGKIVVTAPLSGVAAGVQTFSLRVQDLAGNWSNALNTTVTVTKPNAIFSDTFDSGNLGSWAASAGGVSVSAAAGIPVGGTNRGLQVTLPGGTGNLASYLTDTSPTAETGYHARFSFDANTLTSGSAAATALTVFEARTATNGQVLAIELHKSGSTVQVRAVMSRTGAAAISGAWVTLPAGAHTLQVDWLSGPATGTSPGSLALSMAGTRVSTLAGNTSGLRVDTSLLGVTAGVTATRTSTMAGTAFYDTFVSTRNTLP
jgi:FtsP/CotA-like multicopper oxidase with cupredoxin domain